MRLKRSPEEVEAHMVPQLVRALYPLFYPIEQQDCAIQARHHEKVTEIARQAWRSFVGAQRE